MRLAARRRALVRVRAARSRPRGAGRARRGDQPAGGGRPERFADVAERWRALAARRRERPAEDAGGGGPVAVGGFAFAPDGGAAPHWEGFEPASLIVPEVALARAERDGEPLARLTLAALASPDDIPEELLARLRRRARRAARARRCRCSTRRRPGASRSPARCRPSTTRRRSARAVELIGGGRAREDRAGPRSAGACARARTTRRPLFGVLREEFPSCFVLLRRARRRDADRRQPRAARAPRGPAREHARARRLDAPQRRPGRRRPPRRAAAARRELPRGARDRRAADRAHAAPARGVGRRRARAGARADRQHPAPRDADPRAAGGADRRARAGRADAPDARRRRRAAARRGAADPGARGPRPRLVRGSRRLDRRDRRRRVLRRAALRAAAGQRRPLLRRQRHRARLRPGGRAGRDGDQAAGAAARCSAAERRASTALPHAPVQRDVAPRARCAPR